MPEIALASCEDLTPELRVTFAEPDLERIISDARTLKDMADYAYEQYLYFVSDDPYLGLHLRLLDVERALSRPDKEPKIPLDFGDEITRSLLAGLHPDMQTMFKNVSSSDREALFKRLSGSRRHDNLDFSLARAEAHALLARDQIQNADKVIGPDTAVQVDINRYRAYMRLAEARQIFPFSSRSDVDKAMKEWEAERHLLAVPEIINSLQLTTLLALDLDPTLPEHIGRVPEADFSTFIQWLNQLTQFRDQHVRSLANPIAKQWAEQNQSYLRGIIRLSIDDWVVGLEKVVTEIYLNERSYRYILPLTCKVSPDTVAGLTQNMRALAEKVGGLIELIEHECKRLAQNIGKQVVNDAQLMFGSE